MKLCCRWFNDVFSRKCERDFGYEIFKMKRMKASERKHTPTSINLRLLFLCPLLAGCMGGAGDSAAEDPVREARKQLSGLQTLKKAGKERLVEEIKHWQRKTEENCVLFLAEDGQLQSDSAFGVFIRVNDSIKAELKRLGATLPGGLHDCAYVKFNTSSFVADSAMTAELKAADVFFRNLKAVTLDDATPETLLPVYEKFLADAQKKDFSSQKELEEYICSEDILFNTFLSQLAGCWSKDFSKITSLTEQNCAKIYRAAHSGLIKGDAAIAFMAMRTNRRLVANAKAAEKLLQRGIIKDPAQAQTYLVMLLQPFMTGEPVALYALTKEERDYLLKLAATIPGIAARLAKEGKIDDEFLKDLPTDILKHYISKL